MKQDVLTHKRVCLLLSGGILVTDQGECKRGSTSVFRMHCECQSECFQLGWGVGTIPGLIDTTVSQSSKLAESENFSISLKTMVSESHWRKKVRSPVAKHPIWCWLMCFSVLLFPSAHIGEVSSENFLDYKNRGVNGSHRGQIIWKIDASSYFVECEYWPHSCGPADMVGAEFSCILSILLQCFHSKGCLHLGAM